MKSEHLLMPVILGHNGCFYLVVCKCQQISMKSSLPSRRHVLRIIQLTQEICVAICKLTAVFHNTVHF